MANVQKENGYTPIANQLLEAVYGTNFTATELKIILFVLRFTYGYNRTEHELSLNFISNGIGISKRYVSASIGVLIKDNVLTVVKEHTDTQCRTIKINKDFEQWNNRTIVQQMNHSSTVEAEFHPTVEAEFHPTVEAEFHPTVELEFHQLKTNIKTNIKKDIKKDKCNFQQVIDLYNEVCISLPKVTKLSDSRKKAIKARLNSYTIEDLRTIFSMAEESDFLSGRKVPNSWCSFDWLMKDSNTAKVLDGNYSNKGSVKNAGELSKNGFGYVKSGGELLEELRASAEARGETYKAPDVDDLF